MGRDLTEHRETNGISVLNFPEVMTAIRFMGAGLVSSCEPVTPRGEQQPCSPPLCFALHELSPFMSKTAFAPGFVSYSIASQISARWKIFPIFVRNSESAICVRRYSSASRSVAVSRTVALLKLLKGFIVRFFAMKVCDGTETGAAQARKP